MSIQADVKELQDLNKEIKRLNLQKKSLLDKKKAVELRIQNYLTEKDQPGIKYKDIAIVNTTVQRRQRISDKNKKEKCIDILKKNGVYGYDSMLDDILESIKGSPINKSCIKIQKI